MTVMASHPTRNIVIGWKKLGLVIILILRRETVIMRKMMELGMIIILVRMCARIAEELGTYPRHPSNLQARARSRTPRLKRGRERAIAWKPGSILMTTMAKVGKLSIVSMMNTGRDRMRCLSTEGIWSTEELD